MNLEVKEYIIERLDLYRDITLKRIGSPNGDRWSVYYFAAVLTKDLSWIYEPLPSERDEEHFKKTRFSTPEEAYEFYKSNRDTILKDIK